MLQARSDQALKSCSCSSEQQLVQSKVKDTPWTAWRFQQRASPLRLKFVTPSTYAHHFSFQTVTFSPLLEALLSGPVTSFPGICRQVFGNRVGEGMGVGERETSQIFCNIL